MDFVTPKRIMTNYVIEGAQKHQIKYNDETMYTDEVRIVDFSEQQDTAILEIDANKKPLGIGFTGRILKVMMYIPLVVQKVC